MLLEGKVTLITGSVCGTGAGIARVFAREGGLASSGPRWSPSPPAQCMSTTWMQRKVHGSGPPIARTMNGLWL